MRIVIGVVAVLLALGGTALAQVPQPDPTKSAQPPWNLDPRCAVMGAHILNQATLTAACLGQEGGRAYLNQAPGYHPSQSQTQHSQQQTDRRPRQPRGED